MKIYRLVFNPVEVNTYILADDSGHCLVIDCGCYDRHEFADFVKFLDEKKLTPVMLLNTHCHLDHVFGNKFMLEKYGLRSYSSELDEMNRLKAVEHAKLFSLSMEEPPGPAAFIADNQVIEFGNNKLVALLVPGHTTGSLVYYCEKENCAFTGDVLFSGSIGRSDLEGGNFDILVEGIKNRLFVLPASTVVYPGHGRDTTIGNEMDTNPFFT